MTPKEQKGTLVFHNLDEQGKEVKYLATFFKFENAPDEKGHRLVGSAVARVSKVLNLRDAEETLAVLLPEEFIEDAHKNKWSLVECIKFAEEAYESSKAKRSTHGMRGGDDDLKMLVSLLVNVAAEASPRELLEKLKAVIASKGEDAVAHLDELIKNGGKNARDKKGFIYLRKVNPKDDTK